MTERRKFATIATEAHAHQVLNGGTPYFVWARLTDRDDHPIYGHGGVRTVNGQLQVNVGEWSGAKEEYINEEWVVPRFVFLVHHCDGCHYPPNMCCLQGYDPEGDAIDEAYSWLNSNPPVPTVEIEAE